MFDSELTSLFRQLCSCLLKIRKSFISKYCNLNFQSVLWCSCSVGNKFSVHPSVFQIICWLSCSAQQHQRQHVMWSKFEIDFRQNKFLSENKPHTLNLRGCEDWSWVLSSELLHTAHGWSET
jgi:hypothetical protein